MGNSTDYTYWTMSANGDSNTYVWIVNSNKLGTASVHGTYDYVTHYNHVVRPVITLKKSAIK